MPQSVIDRVNAMAADQPKIITFLDKHGMEIGDELDVITPPETLYQLPGVVGDIAKIPGVDTASAIEDTAVEDKTDGKMNDLINMPQDDPPLVDDGGIDFNPELINQWPTLATMPTAMVTDPTGVPELPQQSKRIRKQVQKYVPLMKGKSYELSLIHI